MKIGDYVLLNQHGLDMINQRAAERGATHVTGFAVGDVGYVYFKDKDTGLFRARFPHGTVYIDELCVATQEEKS